MLIKLAAESNLSFPFFYHTNLNSREINSVKANNSYSAQQGPIRLGVCRYINTAAKSRRASEEISFFCIILAVIVLTKISYGFVSLQSELRPMESSSSPPSAAASASSS